MFICDIWYQLEFYFLNTIIIIMAKLLGQRLKNDNSNSITVYWKFKLIWYFLVLWFVHKLHIGTNVPHIVGSVFGPIRFLLPVCRLCWFLYTLNIYAYFSSHFRSRRKFVFPMSDFPPVFTFICLWFSREKCKLKGMNWPEE